MVTERFIDPEAFEAVRTAARRAYRRAAELVAPQISAALVAAAGQTISEAEWAILTEEVSDAYGDAYLDALIAAGIAFKILPKDADMVARLEEQEEAVSALASTIRELLDQFLQEMIEQGVDPLTIQDRLLDSVTSPLNSRKADMFARTATNTAVNSGFDATFKAARVPALVWISRRDEKVREAHVEVDRDVIVNGGRFDVGGYEAKYPGDPSLPIELRINCRCMLGYVDGDQVRQAVDGTKAAVYNTARQLNIPGRSKMSKPELQVAVIEELCLQGLAVGPDCPSLLDDMNMTALLSHARIANIQGRYRMNRSTLLEAVRERFVTAEVPTWVGLSSTMDAVPMTLLRLPELAEEVINGGHVGVEPEQAAALIEILGRHTEPVDLTLVAATDALFAAVADNQLTRDQMPQIPEEWIEKFRVHLEAAGVTVTFRNVDPLDVFATQSELDGRKVGKMITSIVNGQFRPDTPAFLSSDGFILDGHHRWAALAALALVEPERMAAAVTSVPIGELLTLAHDFAQLNGLESKSHGMAWDPSQPRHPRGGRSGGRWRSHYDSSGHPYRTFEGGDRPSIFDRQQSENWHEERARTRTYERERRIYDVPNREQLDRYKDQFGKGIDSVFPEGGFTATTIPFPSASRKRGEPLYDKAAVQNILAQPVQLVNVDPRTLHASQSGVTREGVDYYVNDPSYASTGQTFADQDQAGNRYPVIYRNPDSGQMVILSGHHRAVAALVSGRPVQAVVVDPRIKVIRRTNPTDDIDGD